jgi:hypothetical protein
VRNEDGLQELPEEKSRQLMKEASTYASSKLVEVELRAHFVKDLAPRAAEPCVTAC